MFHSQPTWCYAFGLTTHKPSVVEISKHHQEGDLWYKVLKKAKPNALRIMSLIFVMFEIVIRTCTFLYKHL